MTQVLSLNLQRSHLRQHLSVNNMTKLYHATISNRVDSILKEGLLIDSGYKNYNYSNECICLTDNAAVAEAFVSNANNITDDDVENESIVVLSIDLDCLENRYLFEDTNIVADAGDIRYFEYRKNIPPEAIQEEYELRF